MARATKDSKKFIQTWLKDNGFTMSIQGEGIRKVTMKADLRAFQRFFTQRDEVANLALNSNDVIKCLQREDKKFCGGTWKELESAILTGEVDMRPYQKVKTSLNKRGILRGLEEYVSLNSPVKRRVFSEHDGELDFDRLNELACFQSSIKMRAGATKTIDIYADICVSAMSSSDDINRYAALCWAISDIIEDAGFSTNIFLCTNSRDIENRYSQEKRVDLYLELELKKAGEYMSQQKLASFFSSNFYRRSCFAMWTLAAEYAGCVMGDGRGMVDSQKDPIMVTPGVIKLSPEVHEGMTDEHLRILLGAFT